MPLKRLTACIASLIAAAAVAVTACATVYDGDTVNPSNLLSAGDASEHSFYGRYSDTDPEAVYYVNISWGSMVFSYNAGQSTWDAVNHQWDDNGRGQWTAEQAGVSDKITVDNHSSAAVKITFSGQENAEKEIWDKTQIGEFVTVSGEDNTISQDSVILNETTRGKAELDSVATVSVLYKPAGYVTSALSTQKVMGTLTVTVNEA